MPWWCGNLVILCSAVLSSCSSSSNHKDVSVSQKHHGNGLLRMLGITASLTLITKQGVHTDHRLFHLRGELCAFQGVFDHPVGSLPMKDSCGSATILPLSFPRLTYHLRQRLLQRESCEAQFLDSRKQAQRGRFQEAFLFYEGMPVECPVPLDRQMIKVSLRKRIQTMPVSGTF